MFTGTGLLVLVAVVASCHGLEMAKIQKPQGRSLTSSTLQWVDLETGQTPPENAVRVTENGPLWCRANQRGSWAAGAVRDGQCHIPFLGNVHKETKYDVLVSINGSARIINKEWDNFQAIPDDGISTNDMLLAFDITEEGEVLPGYIAPNERRAHVLKGDKAKTQDSATLLTENEPIHYLLNQIVRNEDKSQTSRKEAIVSEKTLTNVDKSVKPISVMLDYAQKEIIYWGRIRGTITGLQSTVIDPSGNRKDITWGTENELDHLEQQLVEYELPGETSVDVKLVAVMSTYEAPYSGILTSKYTDDTKSQHPISGFHKHTRLAELRADFTQPYFTENGTEIAGEYIPSQILIHSTTTTTTTTTTPSSGSSADEKPQSDSRATPEGGSHTHPVAEQMSGAATKMASVLLSFSLGLLLTHHLPFMH